MVRTAGAVTAVAVGEHAAKQLWQGARRVMYVHAHPDDETLSTGGSMMLHVKHGAEVLLVTATRGEMGEVVPGPLAHLQGTADLADHRERELAEAMAALGVRNHVFLGDLTALAECAARNHWGDAAAQTPPPRDHRFVDSGMRWADDGLAMPAANAPAQAFSLSPTEQVDTALAAAARVFRPDLIVSYAATGGYRHPDHVAAHQASRRCAQRLGIARLAVLSETERPGRECWGLDCSEVQPRVERALDAYQSQFLRTGRELVHSGGQRQSIHSVEYFAVD